MKTILFFLVFAVCGQVLAQQNTINSYEYWIDNDFESRVYQDISPTANFSFNNNISTDGLSVGLHVFNIRFKDNQGRWSAISSSFFQKLGNQNVQSIDAKIVAYEYWIDNDFDNRTENSVNPTDNFTLNADIPTDNLTVGLHIYNIRFKDDQGRWSAISSSFFQKLDLTNNPDLDCSIVGYEYWINDDFAIRAEVSTNAVDNFTLANNLLLPPLPLGEHYFHIRFKDDCGFWSAVCSDTINVTCQTSLSVETVISCDPVNIDPSCDTLFLSNLQGCDSLVVTCYEFEPDDIFFASTPNCDASLVGDTASITTVGPPDCVSFQIDTFVLAPLPMFEVLPSELITVCEGDTAVFNIEGDDLICNSLDCIYPVTVAGIYNIYVQNSLGCIDTATFELATTTVEEVNLTADICTGESYAFGGEILTTSGTYTIPHQMDNCIDSVLLLTVGEALLADTTLSNNNVLTADVSGGFPPYAYLWNTNEIEDNITITNSGDYTLVVTDANGCTEAFTWNIIVTALSELTVAGIDVQIFPNPMKTDGLYYLKFQATKNQLLYLTLRDVRGVLIEERELQVTTGESLAIFEAIKFSGEYFMEIRTENGASGVLPLLVIE